MTPRAKFMTGAGLVAVTVGFLMTEGIKDTGVYFLNPSELAARVEEDSSDVGVRIGGTVVGGTIDRHIASQTLEFDVTDGVTTFPVVYRGLVPDTFTDDVDVVVEGRVGRDGTIQATTVLAKCGSRYEAVPEDVSSTT
jgi:cytochrome c-type biogenesis protein CcmE